MRDYYIYNHYQLFKNSRLLFVLFKNCMKTNYFLGDHV